MSDVLRFDLAKDPKGNPITYGRVGDSNGLTRRVKVFEDGKPLDLTGWATTFEGNTSNWKTKVFDTEGINIIDATKGDFSYTFPNMAFAVEGQYERAYFSFIKGDQRKSTGDFEIIVLGNSDIDAPEAETIITEYNKLVAELNELQNQAIDEMNRNFTEAQGRISELEVQINDLRNKIDQALTDFENGNFWTKEESFNKEESSANVIDQVIGKVSNENKVILDLKGKIVGSAVENPNDAKVTHTQTLLNPNSTDFFTLSQQAYDQQKDLDGVVLTVSNSLNGRFRQNVYSWDILTVTKKIVGDVFFEGLNADTVAKQVAILKKMVNVKTAVWGFGSNYSGNKLSLKIWGNDTSWIGEANHTEATISKLEYDSTLNTNSFISEDGFVYVTAFSEPSDGNTASSLSVDYANLELEFNSSVHEYINNMIAAYSGENIDKKFVGLENVDNYGTATQAEAESGTATDKFMTPLRTKQHVSSRIATQAEAETGTSNSKFMTPIRTKQFYDQQAIERPKFLSNATNFCAHRGNNAEFPENSVMALKSVTRHRFTEFDVDITKDGKWVVMHDDTVDRTTNGTGRV
ncbi:BppU family phage baseplate upper protein, partial [Enterococcus avium]|uniref:BppU family phage baseplate upper protein n=1 Tax=Enterococcus avium TaxID=33945 RepID=UPI0028901840